MAESRGSLLAKSVQKHAGRAKEKLLQNLGKVDRTADEIFDEHLQNFTRQQNAANRIQKEFNNYIRCIRATQAASKTLLEAIGETYESQWTGHDLLYIQTQSVDMLWQDFSHKLADQVLLPLNTYQGQFPEMRKKIDKRGRKLVDYDSQRHSFQALQTNMKKRDDTKIAKGREQLEEAKRTYEMLNSELHDELPALYDSRILFLVTNLQSLFNAEHVFHSETAKVFGELEAVVDKLATDSQRGSYSVKKTNGSSLPRPQSSPSPLIINNISPVNSTHTDDPAQSPTKKDSPKSEKIGEPAAPIYANDDVVVVAADKSSSSPPATPSSKTNNAATPPPLPTSPAPTPETVTPQKTTASAPAPEAVNGTSPAPEGGKPPSSPEPPLSPPPPAANEKPSINSTAPPPHSKNVEELYDIPVGASTENLPPGVLYRVKATYKYNREDVDELSFEVGEIIQVIEYDDPEEQEEGWLMGMKEGNSGEKGMFPANFTRPL